ncbi:hypothetical protein PIROE2DRAFT_4938, partial [Piromyces sp. E2]
MSLQPFNIDIAIMTNIKIIGNNNGTVLDFNNKFNGLFTFRIIQNKGETIIIENIVYINLLEENKPRYGNNHGSIFRTEVNCDKSLRTNSTSIVFNDCNFYDNTVKLVHLYHINYKEVENYECSAITFKNCNFINNRGLFYSYNSQFYFDNCYISKVEKYSEPVSVSETHDSSFYAQNGRDYVNIKNSIFENINIKKVYPLIEGVELKLDIKNTTFRNCHTNYDYLIHIKSCNNIMAINVKNSTFTDTSNIFNGNFCRYNISDSIFKNITIKNSIPVISDSAYSHFTISNTEFKDL